MIQPVVTILYITMNPLVKNFATESWKGYERQLDHVDRSQIVESVQRELEQVCVCVCVSGP